MTLGSSLIRRRSVSCSRRTAVQFVLRKVGREQDFRRHLQRAAPVLGERLGGEQRILAAAVYGQAGADELELVGDLLAGLARRALRQHVAHQARQPR